VAGAVLTLPVAVILGGLGYFFGSAANQRHDIELPERGMPVLAGDLSGQFARFAHDGVPDPERATQAFRQVAPRLHGVRVLFVPSYLSDSALPSVTLGESLGYMAGIFNWLAEAGIEAEIAAVETEDTVAANAAHLHSIVAASDKPFCFVTQSKGGLDVLEYLRAASPVEREQVRCWIAMQAPFSGSPVADLAVSVAGLPETADVLLRALGGRGESLDDLTIVSRRRYLSDHAADVRAIVEDISPVCLATHIPDPGDFDRPTSWSYPALVWMHENGIPSDGLVTVRSATSICTRSLVLPGIDHTGIVAPGAVAPVDQTSLMKILFALALSRD